MVLPADAFEAHELDSVDLTRRVAEITVSGVSIPPHRQLPELSTQSVRDLAAVLFSADAVGGSQWCVQAASEYAKDRRQFGRPIGQFQGVKHRCANMLGRTELARVATWDAARAVGDPDTASFAAAAAASLSVDGFFQTAKDCVQTLGGIGFTWEHDAHVYLRRATANRALLGTSAIWQERSARLALAGAKRRLSVDLPVEAEAHREELRALLTELSALDRAEQRRRVADEGFISPQWPKPWGRDADALEQLVIDDEFRRAKMIRPNIAVGGWALPPLMVYGTEEQQQRWIPPTLRGEIEWCQLFSEPGAGSDLASPHDPRRARRRRLACERAEGVDVDGRACALGDPARPHRSRGPEARRHLVLHARHEDARHRRAPAPRAHRHGDVQRGLPRRGLRPGGLPRRCRARRLARARARHSPTNGSRWAAAPRSAPASAASCDIVRTTGREDDTEVLAEVGGLVARGYALAVLGFRLTLSALTGADPSGSEASVKKLLGVEHDQKVQEVGLGLLAGRGRDRRRPRRILVPAVPLHPLPHHRRRHSEIQRNIIAERVLGLPKDP